MTRYANKSKDNFITNHLKQINNLSKLNDLVTINIFIHINQNIQIYM